MHRVFFFTALVAAALVCDLAVAKDKVASSSKERSEVYVTVYNNDLALVRDVRSIDLQKGTVIVEFQDVTEQIMPQTVAIKPLDNGKLEVLEQNYEYDLLTPQRLMEKYTGKELFLVKENPKSGEETRTAATLLSFQGEGVFKTKNGITFGDVGRPELPELPSNFVTHPTLMWTLDNGRAGKRQIEASYLSTGMSWKADYVMILDSSDRKADINGWVTLNNTSGATFTNAVLALVAGEINRIAEPREEMYMEKRMAAPSASKGSGFQEEGLFEYHLYTLGRKTTIADRQQKQVALLEGADIQIKQILKIKPGYLPVMSMMGGQSSEKQNVEVFLEFFNSKRNALGMPLPAGSMRVYKADSSGRRQFLGEDSISHTPEDEKVTIKVGKAFDVVAERRQVSYRQVSDRVSQTSWEMKIRNHKEEKITVEIEEPISGDFEVLESSHPSKRINASTLGFTVDVKAGGETVVSYKIQIR